MIDRPTIWSVMMNWRVGHFLNSNFKGTPSQGKHKLFYPPNDFYYDFDWSKSRKTDFWLYEVI